MRSVKDHYDELLGPVYSWIIGDFDNAYANNVALFEKMSVSPKSNAAAVDLGCGPGCQAIPLAERGFSVTAIDFCNSLLLELQERASGLEIRTVCDDMLNVEQHISEVELAVCMGDTLVHLPDLDAVDDLIVKVGRILSPGGRFIATLRDYVAPPPTGADRFIPLRSSDERIFTCFLDYQGDVIDVHDILQVRRNGSWDLRISNYQKLALDYRRVAERLCDAGLQVSEPSRDGAMILLEARKPA